MHYKTKQILEEAAKLIAQGFWVVPTYNKVSRTNNDKNKKLSIDQIKEIIYRRNCNGLGILTNSETNYLSFDIDTKDADDPRKTINNFIEQLSIRKELSKKIKISKTPSNGFHLYVMFSTKARRAMFIGTLAWSSYKPNQKPKQKAIVTGRALGQYCSEYPSKDYKWILNNELIPLNKKEEDELLEVFNIINEDKTRVERFKEAKKKRELRVRQTRFRNTYTDNSSSFEITVWDHFNQKTPISSILRRREYTYLYTRGSKDYYLRPGASSPYSGFVDNNENVYINFSDNADLPSSISGGNVRIFNAYELAVYWFFNGDFQHAAREMFKKGYGKIKPRNKVNRDYLFPNY